jgi:putative acetyltransferase
MTMTTTSELIDAPSWSVRPERAIDLDQIHDLHRLVFGRPAEAELVDAIRSGPDFIPPLSLVGVAGDGSVLGHVLVSRIALEPDDGGARVDVLALAPLAVLPTHTGRGIGTALTAAALEVADARDEPLVSVLGSPAFYGRFGFVPAAEHLIDGPYGDAGEAFQVRLRPGASAPPAGMLIYPAMFEGL